MGSRLPRFTAAQSNMIKGSLDFMAINYYTARYVDESSSSSTSLNISYSADCHCNITSKLPHSSLLSLSLSRCYIRGVILPISQYLSQSLMWTPILYSITADMDFLKNLSKKVKKKKKNQKNYKNKNSVIAMPHRTTNVYLGNLQPKLVDGLNWHK